MDLEIGEPRLETIAELRLAGLDFFGDPFRSSAGWTEENEIGRLWMRFMAWLGKHPAGIAQALPAQVMYEVHVHHEETAVSGEFEVFVGLEVSGFEGLDPALTGKVLSSGQYAAFTLRGEQIGEDWPLAVAEWLAVNGHRPQTRWSFQRYDDRFRGVERLAESELEVWVPLLAP